MGTESRRGRWLQVRLPPDVDRQFSYLCRITVRKKTTVVSRLVADLLKDGYQAANERITALENADLARGPGPDEPEPPPAAPPAGGRPT